MSLFSWTLKYTILGGFFQAGSVPPATKSRLSPLPHEPADFYDRGAPVDIPLDSAAVGANFKIGEWAKSIFVIFILPAFITFGLSNWMLFQI